MGKRSRLNSRMATTKVEEESSSNLDMEDSMKQHEKLNVSDVGEPRDDVEQPPMTLKRIMALFSLACLVAAAQIPLYLIGGTLGNAFENPGANAQRL
jgi:hypothetical protein